MTVRVSDYLVVPNDYVGYARRGADAATAPVPTMAWSASGEAICFPDGETFTFARQLALFIEGFASRGRLIHFGHVLHLLQLLGQGAHRFDLLSRADAGPDDPSAALQRAYVDAGRPLRNAGAFCAVLCADVPPASGPVDAAAVCKLLTNSAHMWKVCTRWQLRLRPVVTEKPPLGRPAFEAHVRKALDGFSREAVEHWLRHGRGPLRAAGRQAAREVAALPRTLAGVLAALARRERCAGAVPFVGHLAGALTLPARRLASDGLPVGGYADVATRGRPEHLLPSQFALDGLEFVRRFAEHELLYFRREEPHEPTREELVVLLDQGVRTWGDVRLVLTAAVLALGKLAERRGTAFRVAATSTGGRPTDPLTADPEALGAMLEASDLSPHPGLALERVLEEPAADRDVVLLTHPRSLREADVAAAARRAGPRTRLFAVVVDGEGAAEVVELRHGTPVPLTRLRVDLATKPAPARPAVAPDPGQAPPAWQGDVEPVGFPFRFGTAGRIRCFDFDYEGRWLLTAGSNGLLHAWQIDGPAREVLPRGMVKGRLMNEVDVVRGVAGGFVACGCLGGRLVTVHYDFTSRRVTAHDLGPTLGVGQWHWHYDRARHTVVVVEASETRAVDLATGSQYPAGGLPDEKCGRAQQAADLLAGKVTPLPWLPCTYRLPPTREGCTRFVHLDSATGTVTV